MARDTMRVTLHISDHAYESLVQMAYEMGYVRGVRPGDRPRGLSLFVDALARYKWEDARPDYVQGTDQWHTGLEPLKERGLSLLRATVVDLGNMALDFRIFPFKTQAPVINGFRREATPPVLRAPGSPLGTTTIKALVAPVLEAIGLGWLRPVDGLVHAPPDLYARPTRRYQQREAKRTIARTLAL